MSNELMSQEIREAIAAGERALGSLKSAEEKLGSARNWGFVDLFGGGLITDLIKHSKMNDAVSYMEAAKRDLQSFQKELKDVNVPMDLRMEVGGFLSFADFFFDGLVADYLVQSKISDAREQVGEVIRMVQILLRDLRKLYENY